MGKSTYKTASEVYEQVQQLDNAEREKLNELLAAEPATSFFASPEIEQAWDQEIGRRIKLLDEGKMKMYEGDAVMRELHKIVEQ